MDADVTMARRALRDRLEALGHRVGSDSHGLRTGLYLLGTGDLAAAVFEFAPSADEACRRMYQGNWGPEMPPRFAVMPADAAADPELEMLAQIDVTPVFWKAAGPGEVSFAGLEDGLRERLG